jgi:hypothetical protein
MQRPEKLSTVILVSLQGKNTSHSENQFSIKYKSLRLYLIHVNRCEGTIFKSHPNEYLTMGSVITKCWNFWRSEVVTAVTMSTILCDVTVQFDNTDISEECITCIFLLGQLTLHP